MQVTISITDLMVNLLAMLVCLKAIDTTLNIAVKYYKWKVDRQKEAYKKFDDQ